MPTVFPVQRVALSHYQGREIRLENSLRATGFDPEGCPSTWPLWAREEQSFLDSAFSNLSQDIQAGGC